MKRTNIINKELQDFIDKIQHVKEITCVILFGSRARGDYTQASDFDLIIIGNFKNNFIKRPLDLLKLNESLQNFELFCYTEREFEEMFKDGNALILDALYEGIPLMGESFFESFKKLFNIMVQKGLKKSRCTWVLP